jgi:dephospho-CoA kinase
MSVWPAKFVIGLTGNIATGKSVVRRMLEALGAFGIDADTLAHRVVEPGTPGCQAVVSSFGRQILTADGQIDRPRLADLVFSDPQALARLEAIVHPQVREAVTLLISKVRQPVVVVEAIKLIEAGLADQSDSVWVTNTARHTQLDRLVEKRSLSPETALQRIQAQPDQALKLQRADVVIDMEGSFSQVWQQVQAHFSIESNLHSMNHSVSSFQLPPRLELQRLLPDQPELLGNYLDQFGGVLPVPAADLAKHLTEMAILVVKLEGHPVGLVSWRMENFITCLLDLCPTFLPLCQDRAFFPSLAREIERIAQESFSEVILWAMPGIPQAAANTLASLDYQALPPEKLRKPAWQGMIKASAPDRSPVWVKPLQPGLFFLGNMQPPGESA